MRKPPCRRRWPPVKSRARCAISRFPFGLPKSGGTRIAFADRTGDWFMLRQLAVTCALVLVPSLAALLVISLYLSCWALRPVECAWDQQRQFVADASHELKNPADRDSTTRS